MDIFDYPHSIFYSTCNSCSHGSRDVNMEVWACIFCGNGRVYVSTHRWEDCTKQNFVQNRFCLQASSKLYLHSAISQRASNLHLHTLPTLELNMPTTIFFKCRTTLNNNRTQQQLHCETQLCLCMFIDFVEP